MRSDHESGMVVFFIILESIVLASTCSLDAFTASLAYGSENIKIPWQSGQVVSLICSLSLGLSLILGSVVRQYIPASAARIIAFAILFIIGIIKLLNCLTKSVIRRHNRKNGEKLNRQLSFSLLNFSFILSVYANPVEADINVDKIISPKEAAVLAVSLSLDGLAVGFGAALGAVSPAAVIITSLVMNSIAVFAGWRAGNRLSRKLSFDVTWLSGVILVTLAAGKLF